MNYYPRHIGDYIKDTSHLSLLEHGIYSRLLDVYYSTEAPIQAAQAFRLIGARSKDEREATESVLREFFSVDGDAYRHARCDAELESMQDKQRKAKASAAKRWDKHPSNANALPTHTEGNAPNTNTNTNTKNQEPEETKARKRAAAARLVSVDSMVADGVDRQNAEDWLTARKAKGLPLTPTAWQQTKDEAVKAGLSPAEAIKAAAGNGWAGFKAAWMLSDQSRAPPQGISKQSALEARNAATVQRLIAEHHAAQ